MEVDFGGDDKAYRRFKSFPVSEGTNSVERNVPRGHILGCRWKDPDFEAVLPCANFDVADRLQSPSPPAHLLDFHDEHPLFPVEGRKITREVISDSVIPDIRRCEYELDSAMSALETAMQEYLEVSMRPLYDLLVDEGVDSDYSMEEIN